MPDAFRCTRCGSTLSTGAECGLLCPACLLSLALDDEAPMPAPSGPRIGPYRIVETLGEGGMGIVYLAEQEEPIHRRVALKVIKVGMDTREVVARFNSERQALALMDHPNIARVLDADASAEGRPYFVMEYVPGLPITDFCDQHQFSTAARLDLIQQVCAAVQHAHQRGVIHRDLKPSNVLVASEDGRAVPKVIDFGIARAIDHDLIVTTIFTEQGRLVGTPEYMSPEQASLGAAPIDSQTDIYALGVMVYVLLTGGLPFEVTALRTAGYDEMRRIIREVEPVKPSTRISTLGAMAGGVATSRRTHPDGLQRQLRGDLDWITLKALEKDPTRRYASASEMAADISRHLRDEPVLAGPPGATYRIGKFIRKHRIAVAVASMFVLLLAAAAVTSTTLFLRAERQRDDAERKGYGGNLLAADLSLQAGELREAKRHLELCVPRLRGWEWRHLKLATDASLMTLDARAVRAAADPRLAISSFEGVSTGDDSRGALALAAMAGNVPALAAFAQPHGPTDSGSPAGSLRLDSPTSILAVSGNGRRLLAMRWSANGTRFTRLQSGSEAGDADWNAVNERLSDEDRTRLLVVDTRSGATVATLMVPQAGRRRFTGFGAFAPQPTRRPIDPLGVVRMPMPPAQGREASATAEVFATVSYPIVARGVLNDDGSRAAVWSWDNVIRLWDVASGRQLASFEGHTDFISRVIFTADGGRLLSASYDGTVRSWDVTSGTAALFADIRGRQVPFTAIAAASTGPFIAVGSEDGAIRIWRDEQQPPRLLTGHGGRINSLALTPDGVHLVSASRDRTLRVWHMQSGVALLKLQGHEDEVTEARVGRDGRLIASSSSDGTIRLWNLRAPVATLPVGQASSGMAFVDGGSSLVVGAARSADVWDLLSGAVARQLPLDQPVASLAVTPNGRHVALGLQLSNERQSPPGLSVPAGLLIDARTLGTSAALPDTLRRSGLVRRIGSIAVSAHGSRIVTGSNDDTVRLWDSASGRQLAEWTASTGQVVQRPDDLRGYPFYSPPVAMRADGALVAASLTHREISVWRLRGDRWVTEPPVKTAASWMTTIAITPDGGRIVFGDIDGIVTIVDLSSGTSVAVLRGHDASADAIAVSPDGSRIATGGVDRTVRIWDARTSELLLTLRAVSSVQSVAFSPDGERLAARLASGAVLVWYSRPPER